MPVNNLLPPGSQFYSVSTRYDDFGNVTAIRIDQHTNGYGALPPPRLIPTMQGIVKVDYYATEDAVHDALNPVKKPRKTHRLAKAMIYSIASLAGLLDGQELNI